MEPEWQEFNSVTSDFGYRKIYEIIKRQEVLQYEFLSRNCSDNSLQTRNIVYDKPKEEPFIIIYKSKPIQRNCFRIMGK